MANNLDLTFQRIADAGDLLRNSLLNLAQVSTGIVGLNKGTEAAKAAFDGITSQISKLSPTLGSGIQSMGDYFAVAKQQTDALSKLGMGANDLTGVFAKVNAAGMSFDRLIQILSDSQKMVAGGTANERMVNQLRIAQMATETTIGKQLIDQNVAHIETIMEATALELSRNGTIVQSEAQMRAVAERAAVTAQTFDVLTRITGQSKDALMEESRTRQADVRESMYRNLLNKEQQKSYDQAMLSLHALGPSVQQLASKLASGGRLSEEDKATMFSLRGESATLSRVMRTMVSETATPEQKQRAQLELEELKVRVAGIQSSKEYFAQVDQGKSALATNAKQIAGENKLRDAVNARLKQLQETMPDATVADAYKSIMTEAQQQQVARKGTGTPAEAAKPDERQAIAIEANRIQAQAMTQVAGFAGAIDQVAMDALTASNNLNTFSQAMREVGQIFGGEATAEQKKERFLQMPDEFKKMLGTDTSTPNVPPPSSLTGPPPASGTATAPSTPQLSGGPPGGTSGGSWWNSITSFFQNYNQGTYGAHGEWFREFGTEGTLAKLHGKEAVVPFEQLDKFMLFAENALYGDKTKQDTATEPKFLKEADSVFNRLADTIQQESNVLTTTFNQFGNKLTERKSDVERSRPVGITEGTRVGDISGGNDWRDVTDPASAAKKSKVRVHTITDEEREWRKQGYEQMARERQAELAKVRTPAGEYDGIRDFGLGRSVEPKPAPKPAPVKAAVKPKEGRLVSPELQRILEEGKAGQAYEVTGPAAEELHNFMQARRGEIKPPTTGRIPGVSDIASRMQEGLEPVRAGLGAAAKMVPQMAAMEMPGSISDVVKSIEGLSGMMMKNIGSPLADIKRSTRGTERATKKMKNKV